MNMAATSLESNGSTIRLPRALAIAAGMCLGGCLSAYITSSMLIRSPSPVASDQMGEFNMNFENVPDPTSLRGKPQVYITVAQPENESPRGPALPGPPVSGPQNGTTSLMLSKMRDLSKDLTSRCNVWYGLEMIEKQRGNVLEVCKPDTPSEIVPSKVFCYGREPFDLGTRYTCVFEDVELVDYMPEFWKESRSAIHSTKLAVQSCALKTDVLKVNWDGWLNYTMRHHVEKPRLECRDVIEHPVIVYTMWEPGGGNLYEQMGDYLTIIEAVLTLQVEFRDTELFLTNIDHKTMKYPIFDAYRTAFSQRGIRMGHEWYKNGTCFRKIAFPPVPGVSTISGNRGRSGQTSCPVGPIFRVTSLFTRSLFIEEQSIAAVREGPRCHLVLMHRSEAPRTLDSKVFVDELNRRLVMGKLQLEGGEKSGYKAFVLDPRGMPMYKNLAILSRVSVLFGIHGAGLAHALFLEPGHSALLELYCADRQAANGHYRTIAAVMGLSYASLSQRLCASYDAGFVAERALGLIPESTKGDCLP